MYDAYCRIFERCGLPYIAVEADSGMMGGAGSHEFMVPSDIGEDHIALCSSCGYAASSEVAETLPLKNVSDVKPEQMEEVSTPGKSTVEDISKLLKIKADQINQKRLYIKRMMKR